MTQKLIIMQGAPGSGKSYIAQILAQVLPAVICSTDDFFMDNGEYKFIPALLAQAHEMNQAKAKDCLHMGLRVVIDNTNIRCWEAKPYVQMGLKYRCVIHFIRCTMIGPNSHGVPDNKVFLMRQTMEDLSVEACLASKAPWEV